jgi:hypothetical protein
MDKDAEKTVKNSKLHIFLEQGKGFLKVLQSYSTVISCSTCKTKQKIIAVKIFLLLVSVVSTMLVFRVTAEIHNYLTSKLAKSQRNLHNLNSAG